MAIAFSSAAGQTNWQTGASSVSFAQSCSGSDRFLCVFTETYNATLRTVSGITYNGVALTYANGITANLTSNFQDAEGWYLDGPASGSNLLAVTFSGVVSFADARGMSYSGKTTTGIEGSNATQTLTNSTSSPSCPITITHSDCWIAAGAYSRAGTAPTAGAGTTVRHSNSVGHAGGDSNGVVATGSRTLAFSLAAGNTWPGVVSIAFSEANAGGGHVLVGAGSSQAAGSATGAVGQTHALAGAAASQAATSGAGAVSQTHTLSGAASGQSATSGTGPISQGATHILVGAATSQAATSGAGAVQQTHQLAGAATGQSAVSGAGAIVHGAVHVLAGAATTQGASSGAGAVGQTHSLVAAPSVQDNIAAASAIVQAHILAAGGAVQTAVSGTGAIGGTPEPDELYPLAGESQAFPLQGRSSTFPLAGKQQTYPLG